MTSVWAGPGANPCAELNSVCGSTRGTVGDISNCVGEQCVPGLIGWAVVMYLFGVMATPVSAQVNTGEVFANATDHTAVLLSNVTVAAASGALIQPQSVITSASGGDPALAAITIVVSNFAEIPPGILDRAQVEAGRTYRR